MFGLSVERASSNVDTGSGASVFSFVLFVLISLKAKVAPFSVYRLEAVYYGILPCFTTVSFATLLSLGLSLFYTVKRWTSA